MYKLLPAQDDKLLFFCPDGDAVERYGAIGYLRADFGRSGRQFHSTWFDGQSRLITYAFKKEFDNVVNSLRDDGQEPPFASRENLVAFCAVTPGKELDARGGGYSIRTQAAACRARVIMIYTALPMTIAGYCPNWPENMNCQMIVTAFCRLPVSLL